MEKRSIKQQLHILHKATTAHFTMHISTLQLHKLLLLLL